MNKRFNNKRLLFILAVLALILIITFLADRPGANGTLKDSLADFDTSYVSKIIIHPRSGKGGQFEIYRQGKVWMVRQGDIVSRSVDGEVRNMMGEVLGIKPRSLASVSKSEAKQYDLTDSLATRVEFLDKRGKVLSDIMFGKLSYKQTGNSQYSGYGGNNLHVTSYVRLYNDKNIYAVDGFLSFTFNGSFDDWRDKTILKANINDITKITFTYPADSSFILFKDGNAWKAAGKLADSAKTAGYLNSLAMVNGRQIADNYKTSSPPLYRMELEGNNGLNIKIDCYAGSKPDEYIIHSEMNPDMYFSAGWKNLPGRLLVSSSYFLSPLPDKRK